MEVERIARFPGILTFESLLGTPTLPFFHFRPQPHLVELRRDGLTQHTHALLAFPLVGGDRTFLSMIITLGLRSSQRGGKGMGEKEGTRGECVLLSKAAYQVTKETWIGGCSHPEHPSYAGRGSDLPPPPP